MVKPLRSPRIADRVVRDRVERYREEVERQKARVALRVREGQDQLALTGAGLIGEATRIFEQESAAVRAQTSERLAQLEQYRISAKESIEEERQDAHGRLALLFAERLGTLLLNHFTRRAEVSAGSEERATTLESHAGSEAARVLETSESNARAAEAIGERKAAQYRDANNGDEIARFARDTASEVATTLREQGTQPAESIRRDGTDGARQLRDIGSEATASFDSGLPTEIDSLVEIDAEARRGVDDNAATLVPQIDAGVDRAVADQLRLQGDTLHELTLLQVQHAQNTAQAVATGQEAIAEAGRMQLEQIDARAEEVIEQVEAQPDVDPVDLDEQLGQEGRDLSAAVDQVTEEMLTGVGDMETEIESGFLGVIDAAARIVEVHADTSAGLVETTIGALDASVAEQARVVDEIVAQSAASSETVVSEAEQARNEAAEETEQTLDEAYDPLEESIDEKACEALKGQPGQLTELERTIDERARELQSQSWLERAVGAVLDFLWDALSFLAGLVLGILWAIVRFILLLIALIVILVVLLFALVVVLALLWVVLAAVFGPLIASLVVLVVGTLLLVAIGLVVVLALVVGIVLAVVDIVVNIYRAFTEEGLSPFDRGFLLGEAIGDIIIFLLPFVLPIKGKPPRVGNRWRLPRFPWGERPVPPGERPPRLPGDRPPRIPGERPPRERPPGERPPRERPPGERPPRERPPGERPPGERPPGERPPGERPPGERPPGERPPGERPPRPQPLEPQRVRIDLYGGQARATMPRSAFAEAQRAARILARESEIQSAELARLYNVAAQHNHELAALRRVIPNWNELPRGVQRFLRTPRTSRWFHAWYGTALQTMTQESATARSLVTELGQRGVMVLFNRRQPGSRLRPDVQFIYSENGNLRVVMDWTSTRQAGKITKYDASDVWVLFELIYTRP